MSGKSPYEEDVKDSNQEAVRPNAASQLSTTRGVMRVWQRAALNLYRDASVAPRGVPDDTVVVQCRTSSGLVGGWSKIR